MGMESVYKLSVILNMVDNLSSQMGGVGNNVTNTVNKLNTAFGTMQKAGAAMAGVGGAITGLCMKTVTATFDTQNALGELSSLILHPRGIAYTGAKRGHVETPTRAELAMAENWKPVYEQKQLRIVAIKHKIG